MHFLCIEQVPFETAAALADWAKARGHTVETIAAYAGKPYPPIARFDGVFIMGGPMNVYQHRDFPWLVAEKTFIQQCLADQKYLVGACLGAQLLADALGGKVFQNPYREIGWHKVWLTPAGQALGLDRILPKCFLAFHWHGDTFTLPEGAVHLAENQACKNQAFLYGQKVLGLQCHLEYTQQSIEELMRHCPEELNIPGTYVQSAEQIRAGYPHLAQTQQWLWALMDWFFNRSAER